MNSNTQQQTTNKASKPNIRTVRAPSLYDGYRILGFSPRQALALVKRRRDREQSKAQHQQAVTK